MSLTSFVKMADVKGKLKSLRPKPPRKINAPLRVESRSPRWMLVGTAFDYFLRFELQRRVPHALSGQLEAESAPDCIRLFTPLPPTMAASYEEWMTSEETAKKEAERARNVVARAKIALALYLEREAPSRDTQADLADHAIRLAKLDDMCRALRLDTSFEEADPEDVEDLFALLAIVPFDTLIRPQTMLLNPDFGETSLLVGGADTDLITGDVLVDFKTTKTGEVTAAFLDQLLGYFLLARHQRRTDPTFPAINRLAIYFCRHGHLWTLDATDWTENQQFAETEEWFFTRAKEVFSSPKG